jgi:hypothetical protein
MFGDIISGPGIQPLTSSVKPNISGIVSWDSASAKFSIVNNFTGAQQDVWPTNQVVQLDARVQTILSWAELKMSEEIKMKNMIENNAAVKEAVDHLLTVMALVK